MYELLDEIRIFYEIPFNWESVNDTKDLFSGFGTQLYRVNPIKALESRKLLKLSLIEWAEHQLFFKNSCMIKDFSQIVVLN